MLLWCYFPYKWLLGSPKQECVVLEEEVAAPKVRNSREVSQVGTSNDFHIDRDSCIRDTGSAGHGPCWEIREEFLLPWKGLSWLLRLVLLGFGKSHVL